MQRFVAFRVKYTSSKIALRGKWHSEHDVQLNFSDSGLVAEQAEIYGALFTATALRNWTVRNHTFYFCQK